MTAEDKIYGSVTNHKLFKLPPHKNVNIYQTRYHSQKYFSSWYSFCTMMLFLFGDIHNLKELYMIPEKFRV